VEHFTDYRFSKSQRNQRLNLNHNQVQQNHHNSLAINSQNSLLINYYITVISVLLTLSLVQS